jgi:hypothetical protein
LEHAHPPANVAVSLVDHPTLTPDRVSGESWPRTILYDGPVNRFGLTEVRVRGFRTFKDVRFRPGSISALVGEANAGKSNLLTAIRTLLDPDAPPLLPSDGIDGTDGSVRISGRMVGGARVSLKGTAHGSLERIGSAPVVFVPAALRGGRVLEPAADLAGTSSRAAGSLAAAMVELVSAGGGLAGESGTGPANALVRGIEACCDDGVEGLVILIEEPELYLRPQAQRYLYRLLREAASSGNQVIYSTHSPAFLNVARLEELVLVERRRSGYSTVTQPEALLADDEFRAQSEFDAERSELFLARAAVLVEGLTEKLALPFVFRALGYDPDREAISIVECGGKSNIPLFARVCAAVDVPFLAIHDRDASPGIQPSAEDVALNDLIAATSGIGRTVVLEPDFEAVAGLAGHRHKPMRAWGRFRSLGRGEIPPELTRVVEISVRLARAAE